MTRSTFLGGGESTTDELGHKNHTNVDRSNRRKKNEKIDISTDKHQQQIVKSWDTLLTGTPLPVVTRLVVPATHIVVDAAFHNASALSFPGPVRAQGVPVPLQVDRGGGGGAAWVVPQLHVAVAPADSRTRLRAGAFLDRILQTATTGKNLKFLELDADGRLGGDGAAVGERVVMLWAGDGGANHPGGGGLRRPTAQGMP